MIESAKIFEEIVQKRKSYRVFDSENPISDEIVKRSLERAILSPNSSNMQLWEFYIVSKKEDIEEISKICLNQNGAKTASQIIVFVARPDKWKERQEANIKNLDAIIKDKTTKKAKMAFGYYNKIIPLFYETSFPLVRNFVKSIITWKKSRNKPFYRDSSTKDVVIVAQKSVALAAQTFMLSIAAEGYDSLPMEGIDSVRMKAFLNLPKTAHINMTISVGKGMPEGIYGPRFRIPYNEVVFKV